MSMAQFQKAQGLEYLRASLMDQNANFRNGQWEAIDALINQRQKLLVVQRTGWGKSAVYFIATRLLRSRGAGPTLIVSPLLALMRNQTVAAERLGLRAVTINSANENRWSDLNELILRNNVDLIIISPERLENADFRENVLAHIANRIGLLVVDEAHCISDWGHDFRPSYRLIVNILQQMPPNMPVLGTTATANNRVLDDIRSQLGGINIQRGSLMRDSLALQVLPLPDQSARLAWLVEHLPNLPRTGIVYTLTKRDADQVSTWLNMNGIDARAYYSGIAANGFEDTNAYRLHLEELLQENKIKVLVATTALGMGYDKPDIGFVVHFQTPGSIVAYYQQVGRAGRDIEQAVGILMSGREDAEIHEYFRAQAFPNEREVADVLRVLEEHDGLSVIAIEQFVNLRHTQIEKVLKFLSVEKPSPVVKYESKWRRTSIQYQLNTKHLQRLTGQREEEWIEVQNYLSTQSCLMEFLAKALNDELPEPCGKCTNCLGRDIVSHKVSHQMAILAAQFIMRADLPLECKKQVTSGAFRQYEFPYRLNELRAETGRILSRWGDAGWGQIVKDGKHSEHFGDNLVGAVAEMIQQRWQPEPMPTWVTVVPSSKHPKLMPDFAKRLADKLGLPFIACVSKVRDNDPQKCQENSFQRCRNLDGIFKITQGIPDGPLFLIDDVVDSAWTLTVISALLRQAGSGKVFPLALAQTTTDN